MCAAARWTQGSCSEGNLISLVRSACRFVALTDSRLTQDPLLRLEHLIELPTGELRLGKVVEHWPSIRAFHRLTRQIAFWRVAVAFSGSFAALL